VSQSLRTGTPVHSVLPETLLDRLLLHHQPGLSATPEIDGRSEIGLDEMQSLDHMFYASAVIAVYQMIQVRTRGYPIMLSMLNSAPVCSAWMNFMLSPADFAGEYISPVSRNGSSSTSRGGEPRRPPSHEPIPLLSESRMKNEPIPLLSERLSLRVKRAK